MRNLVCTSGNNSGDCWTTRMVEDRLIEAADVAMRLPEHRFSEFGNLVGRERSKLCPPPPLPEQISRMDQAMQWLSWLEHCDAKLVWARAERSRWKVICWKFGISRATAHRRWEYSLSLIALRLNGEQVPAKQSRRHLVERLRSVLSPKM